MSASVWAIMIIKIEHKHFYQIFCVCLVFVQAWIRFCFCCFKVLTGSLHSSQVHAGEFILSINDCSTRLLSVKELTAEIQGVPGTAVVLTISSTAAACEAAPQRPAETPGGKTTQTSSGISEVSIARGANGGLGIRLFRHSSSSSEPYTITEMKSDGAAAMSGKIKVGDTLLEVGGNETSPLTVDQVSALICGESGSSVRLKLHRLQVAPHVREREWLRQESAGRRGFGATGSAKRVGSSTGELAEDLPSPRAAGACLDSDNSSDMQLFVPKGHWSAIPGVYEV
jgi:hypothetical protein